MVHIWIAAILITILNVSERTAQSDPCTSHTVLADVTMKSDFVLNFGINPLNSSQPTGWVRYMPTINGSLMTDCPQTSECGVIYQYWMNDSLPSEDEGITPVTICGRAGVNCCSVNLTINAKNCSSFVVYELVTIVSTSRYCFAADPTTTTTSTTTAPITSSSTNKTVPMLNATSPNNGGGLNITIISAAAGTVIILIIFLIVVFVCVRKRINRSVADSKGTKKWQDLNIAAIYRTKRKDLLIPRLMYLSGKPKSSSSMVYLNPRDEDWVDMKEFEEIPRTRSELEIFSPPEIDRLGIDISAVYQTRAQDRFIANTKFSPKRMFKDDKFSLYSFEDYLPFYDVDKIRLH